MSFDVRHSKMWKKSKPPHRKHCISLFPSFGSIALQVSEKNVLGVCLWGLRCILWPDVSARYRFVNSTRQAITIGYDLIWPHMNPYDLTWPRMTLAKIIWNKCIFSKRGLRHKLLSHQRCREAEERGKGRKIQGKKFSNNSDLWQLQLSPAKPSYL